MAYSNAAATYRADLQGVVEEAAQAQATYIGTKVLPPLGVKNRLGQYPKWKLAAGELLNNDVKKRAPNTSYPRIIRAYDQDTYETFDYGIEEGVDDTDFNDVSRFFDLEQAASKNTLRKTMLGHEVRVAAAINNTTNFGSATNSITAYTAANIATFDIGWDIDLAKGRILAKGESADDLSVVMSSNVFIRACASTKLNNRIRGSASSDSFIRLSEADVARALGVKQVLVGRAVINSAGKGGAFSSSAVWGDTYVWVGSIVEGDFFNGGAGRTLYWENEGGIWTPETYRDEKVRSDIVRCRHHVIEKVINGNAGDLIATQYS